MFVDEIKLKFKAGHGGAGKVSFYPKFKAGPDGGNGGKGGDVYAESVSDILTLGRYSGKYLFAASDGENGGSNQSSGHSGSDLVIQIPVGATLTNTETGEIISLDKVGDSILLCKGGIGGLGNYQLRSSRNTTPKKAQGGRPGEEKEFNVVVRLIADYGLIGLPNAGKSSLLNALTSANVRTAAYPFTTLEPNLGAMGEKILADIPGLIEGASKGKGLGVKFLKHIEKVSLLLHCIAADSENVLEDYKVVRGELENFNRELLEKPELILLTKSDLVSAEVLKEKIKNLKSTKRKVLAVSVYDDKSLEDLKQNLG